MNVLERRLIGAATFCLGLAITGVVAVKLQNPATMVLIIPIAVVSIALGVGD